MDTKENTSIVDLSTESDDSDSSGDEDFDLTTSCDCSRKCYSLFEEETIVDSRLGSRGMNYTCSDGIKHQHVFMMGALNTLLCDSELTINKSKLNHPRVNNHAKYMFHGISVCQKFFSFVNSYNIRRIEHLKKVFISEGVSEQIHGNTKKSSSVRALPFSVRESAVKFINKFADQNGLVLPGRMQNYRDMDLKILPSSMNKKYVFDLYVKSGKEANEMTMKISAWYETWNLICPTIVVQQPKTDLCAICQHHVTSMGKMNNYSEEEKLKRIAESSNHLQHVMRQRKFYNNRIALIQKSIEGLQLELKPNQPKSFKNKMHYSFDCGQQIHLPFSSQQVGPLYFLCGYKVGLFGVAVEPLGQYVLYLIPESCATGKGANLIISLLDHFFEAFGLGEEDVEVHADNCTGQNKNNFLMQYAAYDIMKGRHKSFRLSFLPVGHTKFAPDTLFGIFKKKFRLSDANTLEDIENLIKSTSCIKCCSVGNETGDVFVETFDWKTYFQQYKPAIIPDISKYHDFYCTDENYGQIHVKESPTAERSNSITIFSSHCTFNTTSPKVIPAVGLSQERKLYLYNKIRPFTKEYGKDILCPKPPVEKAMTKKKENHFKFCQIFLKKRSQGNVVCVTNLGILIESYPMGHFLVLRGNK